MSLGEHVHMCHPIASVLIIQPCPILCSPMDHNLLVSSVHGILQARILELDEGLPFPFPGDLLNPKIESRSPALQADCLPSEPLGKPYPIATTL